MKELRYWDSGREEIRNIPVVCAACDQRVSVGGQIEDGVMICDPCPNCGTVITGGLYVDDGEKEEEDRNLEIGAEVEWLIDGGVEFRRSNSFGPLTSVPSLLMAVMMSGVDYFSQPNLTKDYLNVSLACMLTGNLLPIAGVEDVMQICVNRLEEPPEQAGPRVIKLDGNNGKIHESEHENEETENHDE